MGQKTLKLSAIDPEVVVTRYLPEEIKVRNKEYVAWGKDNDYPDYLWSLYNDVATLQSIVNGTIDYICGNGITANFSLPGLDVGVINKKGDRIEDLVRKVATDVMIFGGYAIQVIRNRVGEVAELYYLDFMKVRSDAKNATLFYADDWSAWSVKAIRYPAFDPDDTAATSILYNKGHITRSVYPTPLYGAAIVSCEIEKAINEFHLNNITNGFAGNVIISFNNGVPDEEEQEEIEKNVVEKYGSYKNAGRILLSFNDSAENKTTVERIDSDNFDDKYSALAERSRTQIFTALRAIPNLFGDVTNTTGFNSQEFAEAFSIFNKTVVRPIQSQIVDSIDKIVGVTGTISIAPFNLNNEMEVE